MSDELFIQRGDGLLYPSPQFRKPGDLRRPDNNMKARQLESKEDRSIPFRIALTKYGVNATDVDIWIFDDLIDKTKMVLEVTCPNKGEEVYAPKAYLAGIDSRRDRDLNDKKAAAIGRDRNIPVFLVCFEPDVDTNENARVWRRVIWLPEGFKIATRDWQFWRAKEFFARLKKFSH